MLLTTLLPIALFYMVKQIMGVPLYAFCFCRWVRTLSGNSLRQTVHTHRASVHQAAKLVAALLRVVRVAAGLEESNVSLPPGL